MILVDSERRVYMMAAEDGKAKKEKARKRKDRETDRGNQKGQRRKQRRKSRYGHPR